MCFSRSFILMNTLHKMRLTLQICLFFSFNIVLHFSHFDISQAFSKWLFDSITKTFLASIMKLRFSFFYCRWDLNSLTKLFITVVVVFDIRQFHRKQIFSRNFSEKLSFSSFFMNCWVSIPGEIPHRSVCFFQTSWYREFQPIPGKDVKDSGTFRQLKELS